MISLIVPVRDWPVDRIEACIASFSAVAPSVLSDIVVVDFGSATPVTLGSGPKGRARVVRVEAAVWSLAEAINVGVVAAHRDILAKTDADILLAPDSVAAFEARVRELAAGAEFGLGLSPAIDLPLGLEAAAAWTALKNGEDPGGTLRPRWGQGGLAMFLRSDWERIGGYDSRLTGWGNEDNDFAERLRRAGRRIDWTAPQTIKIYHVAHPPSFLAPTAVVQRRRNQAIMAADKSVFRAIGFRHSSGVDLAAPAIVTRIKPHVTLAVATKARPGRDRMTLEAVSSFRGQIGNDFEVVVVDNGSTDEEYERLSKRLRAIRGLPGLRIERAEQASIPATRNMITDLARGQYICVVDDDDIALGNRLSDHLAGFVKDGTAHGSHGGWLDFDEDTGQIERNPGRPRRLATLLLGRGKITAHPACLYRTDVLRAVRYDESFSLGSDMDLALRMAALGLRITHTQTYVTLRRFHASNVTFTGTTEQAVGGTRARDRLWAVFNRRHQAHLQEQGKDGDPDEFCRNHLTIEEIAALIPAYAGKWRLTLPIGSLVAPGLDAGPLTMVVDRVGGEFTTLRAGLDQPMMFISDPIKGAGRALKAVDTLETIVGVRPGLISAAQHELDRRVPIEWSALFTAPQQVLLRSPRLGSAEQVLEVLASIDDSSLLRASLRTVSDADDSGACHYIISGPYTDAQMIQSTALTLSRLARMPFAPISSFGAGNPLLLGDRVH